MSTSEYIAMNINRLSLSDRYTVARILVFRMYEPIQTNDGCHILLDKIDKDTINEIYNFWNTKLSSWFGLFMLCSKFSKAIYIYIYI